MGWEGYLSDGQTLSPLDSCTKAGNGKACEHGGGGGDGGGGGT